MFRSSCLFKNLLEWLRKGLRYQGNMCLHVDQCNKSGCMWVYFSREEFRFCFDINGELCKAGCGYTMR